MQLTGHLTESVFNRYDIQDHAETREAVARVAQQRRPILLLVQKPAAHEGYGQGIANPAGIS